MDRTSFVEAKGDIDTENGEFWVENPFLLQEGGHNLSAYERNRLYLNVEGSDFVEASFASGTDIDSDSRGVVFADFNRDGAIDLLVSSVGGGPLRLFMNRFPQKNRWIRLALEGKTSNRPGIGCRAILQCDGRQIVRDLFPANGFMGSGPTDFLIGVGKAETVEKLTIRWPTGKVQGFENLPTNKEITITESSSDVVVGD
jgi:enediyne biosynthesis protein E4